MSQPKSSTTPPTLATGEPTPAQVARAQAFASQLLRASHDAANAIDRAARMAAESAELAHDAANRCSLRASSRMSRLRAFGAAQDCKVLARRMLDALAGVVPDDSDADVLLAAAAVLERNATGNDGLFAADLRTRAVELLNAEAARLLEQSAELARVADGGASC